MNSSTVLNVLKEALPVPSFDDKAAAVQWWVNISPSMVELIADLKAQRTATGEVKITLPGDRDIILYSNGQCCTFAPFDIEEILDAVPPEAWDEHAKSFDVIAMQEWMKQNLSTYVKFLPLLWRDEPMLATEINLVDYQSSRAKIHDGDILMFRRNHRFSNWLITQFGRTPSPYCHAAMACWWRERLFCAGDRAVARWSGVGYV